MSKCELTTFGSKTVPNVETAFGKEIPNTKSVKYLGIHWDKYLTIHEQTVYLTKTEQVQWTYSQKGTCINVKYYSILSCLCDNSDKIWSSKKWQYQKNTFKKSIRLSAESFEQLFSKTHKIHCGKKFSVL